MKKSVMLVLTFVLFVNFVMIVSAVTNCTDSDGGMNIYAKGYASSPSNTYNPNNQTLVIYDQCVERYLSGGVREVDSCSGSNCAQEEAICDENGPAIYSPGGSGNSCPNGCSNGVCVNKTASATCTDSDGGLDYYVRGYRLNQNPSYAAYNIKQYDYCIKNPTISSGNVIADEAKEVSTCSGNDCYVIEYQCKDDLSNAHRGYKCENGCGNGVCYSKTASTTNASMNSECSLKGGSGTCEFAGKEYFIKVGSCYDADDEIYGESAGHGEIYISYSSLNLEYLRGMLFSNMPRIPPISIWAGISDYANFPYLLFVEQDIDSVANQKLLLSDGNIVTVTSSLCNPGNPYSSDYSLNLSFMEFRDSQIITQEGIYDVYYGDLIKIDNAETMVAGIIWQDDLSYLWLISPNGLTDGNMNAIGVYPLDARPGYGFLNEVILTYGKEPNYVASNVKVRLIEMMSDDSLSLSHAKIEVSKIGEGENGTISPSNETGAIELPSDGSIICGGCQLENKCYPFGYRKSGGYCSETGQFVVQIEGGSCDNDFECSSNLCVSDQCVGRNLWQKILDFFRSIFGG